MNLGILEEEQSVGILPFIKGLRTYYRFTNINVLSDLVLRFPEAPTRIEFGRKISLGGASGIVRSDIAFTKDYPYFKFLHYNTGKPTFCIGISSGYGWLNPEGETSPWIDLSRIPYSACWEGSPKDWIIGYTSLDKTDGLQNAFWYECFKDWRDEVDDFDITPYTKGYRRP